MKKIYSCIMGVLLALFSVMGLSMPALAITCPDGSKQTTAPDLSLCNAEDPTNADTNLMGQINIIINVALGVIAVVAVGFIIVGGLQYTTSQGDPGKIAKAKNTIMYSIIGLVVALLAFAIVNFVLTNIF